MEGTVFNYALVLIPLVFYVAIACVLVPKYRRTRDPGLLWLGIALVVWPLISHGFTLVRGSLAQRAYHEENADFFPYSLFSSSETPFHEVVSGFTSYSVLGQVIITQILLLTAVAFLHRTKREASEED